VNVEDFFNKLYAEEDEALQCALVTSTFMEWCSTGRFDLCKEALREVNIKKCQLSVIRALLISTGNHKPLKKHALRKRLLGNFERHLLEEKGQQETEEILVGLK
jgi:hypothetical protein